MRGLGAALTHIGQQGMEAAQQAERDNRLMLREQALLTLREQMSEARAIRSEERELKNYARQTPLVTERRSGEFRAAEPYRIANDERRAQLSEQRDDRTARRQELMEIRRERRAFQREERARQREDRRAGRRVRSRDVTQDGYRIISYEDGSSWRSEYRVRGGSGDDDDWESDGSGGGGGGGSGGGGSGGGYDGLSPGQQRGMSRRLAELGRTEEPNTIVNVPGAGPQILTPDRVWRTPTEAELARYGRGR
jgi:hypothetical protein